MNILVFAPKFAYEVDISRSFIHNQLKEMVKAGHSVRVIIPLTHGKGLKKNNCEIDGVEVEYIYYYSFSNFGEKYGINDFSLECTVRKTHKSFIRDFEPDIIYVQTFSVCIRAAMWLKKKYGWPVAVTGYGSDVTVPYNKGYHNLIRKRAQGLDFLACDSSKVKRCITELVPDSEVEVVLNGFRHPELNTETDKRPYSFIQVCNLIAQKKTDITIRAFAEIKQKYPQAHLTIGGDGVERDNLENLCVELGIREDVDFLGYINNSQVLRHMQKSEFFIMPSVNEGFGIAYAEAMACRCIAIGTRGEGIEDLIVSGENGILVPPNDVGAIVDAVEACYSSESYMTSLSENGFDAVSTMTWELNAKTYLEAFEKLL